MSGWLIALIVVGVVLLAVVVRDLTQTDHAIRRNFPIIGHLRYLLERIGPELRQYIVTDNDEERPFSRDERRYVYASAKGQNNYFGFGTDQAFEEASGYVLVRHHTFPHQAAPDPDHTIPCAKVLGEHHDRPGAFRPASIINTSAMSFGSLSGRAIEAINRGAALGGFLHNTGEGGIASHHLHGGDLVFQFGTGYFGCRDADGHFSMDALLATLDGRPVRAIEVKLSQGAKPGLGGVLPGPKVTAEIAQVRGVPEGETLYSPNAHSAFGDVAGLIDFVESVAAATGIPVGIKAAVGDRAFWIELADTMTERRAGPDFIAIDGGEGGTGAGPLVFTDHVALPLRLGLAEVFAVFAERQMHEQVVWMAAGKLGFAEEALVAMGLGADCINIGREAMMAIGCIQAQRCHTDHCPTGVATQNRWLSRGLDPTSKADRLANYVMVLRQDLLRLSWACGVAHPALVDPAAIELLDGVDATTPLLERYGHRAEWHDPGPARRAAIEALMP